MDYRIRWQQRRQQEARRRALYIAGAVLLVVGIVVLAGRWDRGQALWLHETDQRGPVFFTAHTGAIYTATMSGIADALWVQTGHCLWHEPVTMTQPFGVPPSVGPQYVVHANYDGHFLAVGRDSGVVEWSVKTADSSRCPPLVDGGMVYVGTDGGLVLALDEATGVERWRATVGSAVNSGFALVRGMLVFGTAEGRVLGLLAKTGRPAAWRYRILGAPVFAPPSPAGQHVVIGTDRGHLVVLDPLTGAVKGQAGVPEGGLIRSAPVVEDNVLYAGTTDGWLTAHRLGTAGADGQLERLWARRIGPALSAGPAAGRQYIYCGDGNRHVVAVDRETGKISARWRCPSMPQGSLSVVNGKVIVGTAGGEVVAFGEPPE